MVDGDETVRVKQATQLQRIVSLEARIKEIEKKSQDYVSKKAIAYILGLIYAVVTTAAAVIVLLGG